MSGFQVYNSAGKLTIDSDNRTIAISQQKAMGNLTDVGYYQIQNSLGGEYSMGFLQPNFFPSSGVRWFQPQTNGAICFPGAYQYTPGSGRFMITSNTNGLASGYLDVHDSSGRLVWSAASAATMPRIMGFFTISSGYNLASPITLTSPIANPWICISQCPGNISDDGSVVGYSGILLRRNSTTSFSLQYVNKLQKNYTQAMGGNGFSIALAYFTGY
ncbi:MAG: hypothetical protein K0S95_759 [Pantoea eucrina]|jgi:hypothetical protein|nr:hypothetical protein [Pantoea eucrina]